MQLTGRQHLHLTYCTNIHPGERWADHFLELKRRVPLIKKRVSPGRPFGLGLRVSGAASTELLQSDRLSSFRQWMNEEDLYLFTINGFPFGNFHRNKVKEQVYAPDWRSLERVSYTRNLISILGQLLPDGVDGGISTSPLSYKRWLDPVSRQVTFELASRYLSELALEMATIESYSGRELHLDIEPEPDCLLENGSETVEFFQEYLLPEGCRHLKKAFGTGQNEAEQIIRRHIRVCFDTCHFAVEFEDMEASIKRFQEAGIGIGKLQISSALKMKLDPDPAKRSAAETLLRGFDEPTYLHQVVERRRDGTLRSFRDLPDALSGISDPEAEEWRVHFHLPLFLERFGEIHTTQAEIGECWKPLLERTDCRHLEVETYTWEVLPEPLKIGLEDSIVRELGWVLRQFEEMDG